jgi:hypothetical protein
VNTSVTKLAFRRDQPIVHQPAETMARSADERDDDEQRPIRREQHR